MAALDELIRVAPIKGNWFHSIEVLPGVWTNGHKSREVMAAELFNWGYPADLTGKSVLDIGCADGGFSIEAIRRGARSVLAIDEQKTRGLGLILAADVFPTLEYRQVSLFSDAFMTLPTFDFVIFAGVLYHVHDMLEALKRVRARVTGEVLIETHINESLGTSQPYAIYYERDELGGDNTNWWGPNIPCLEAMFRTAGFAFEPRHVMWENERHANGRASYGLRPIQGSVTADVIQSATGSNSMLEEARANIARLHEENVELRRRLSAL